MKTIEKIFEEWYEKTKDMPNFVVPTTAMMFAEYYHKEREQEKSKPTVIIFEDEGEKKASKLPKLREIIGELQEIVNRKMRKERLSAAIKFKEAERGKIAHKIADILKEIGDFDEVIDTLKIRDIFSKNSVYNQLKQERDETIAQLGVWRQKEDDCLNVLIMLRKELRELEGSNEL